MSHTNIPGEESQRLLKKLNSVIAKPNYSGLYGITIEKGDGCYISDADGNRFLDCLAAASTNGLGYNNKNVVLSYTIAALEMQHSCFLYSPNKYALELAEKLIDITPGDFEKRVMFGLSGSDACDGAIKATRRYTNSMGIIHFKNDYHGSTGLSMPASDFSDLNKGLFENDGLFIELIYPTNQDELKISLEKIEDTLKSGKAGGIIAESIQGDNGVRIPIEGFFSAISELTKKYNAVLIIDEVQSGMGRTGKWWAIEHENVVPDILVTAKGLSGGYAPVSAVIGREVILNSLGNGQHLFTYAGHAPSTAAALEVIKTIEQDELIHRNQTNGIQLLEIFFLLKTQFPEIIVDVRGKGLMIGVEINICNDDLAGKIFATRCVEKGLYVGYFGEFGQVIRVEPPYYISQKNIELIRIVFTEVLEEFNTNSIPLETIENVKKYSVGL